jgi:hypothetical protein
MTTSEWLCQANASWSDALLACGAMIVAELRMAVLTETQFTCSAGIGHNKVRVECFHYMQRWSIQFKFLHIVKDLCVMNRHFDA